MSTEAPSPPPIPAPQRPDIVLKERFHATARAAFALIGAALLILPAYDLRQAFLKPGWWTLFFGIIVGGAVWIGAAMLLGALFGETGVWRLGREHLDIALRSPFRRRRLRLRAADIATITLDERQWDDGPDTFTVDLTLVAGGPRLVSPRFAERAAAEQFTAELRDRLGLAPDRATLPRDPAPLIVPPRSA